MNTKAEFDYIAFEGEASVRRMIIGHWDDVSNESSGTITVNAKGLKPNTEYQVGIVGFDKDMREKFLLYDFTTGEPTGPLPELTAEPVPSKRRGTKRLQDQDDLYGLDGGRSFPEGIHRRRSQPSR